MAVDPIIAGSAIQAGAALIGGAMTSSMDKRAARIMAQQQKDFAQHGVRWRVEDAQRAGVHPLYALGASLPQFSPVTVNTGAMGEAVASAGEAIGEGVSRYGMEKMRRWEAGEQRKYLEDELRMRRELMGAQVDEARAAAAESRSRTLNNVYQLNKERFSLSRDPLMSDAVEYVPDRVISGNSSLPGYVAGVHEGMKRWRMPGGLLLDIPWSDEGIAESLEGLGLLGKAAVVAYNMEVHGPEWLERASGQWFAPVLFQDSVFEYMRERGDSVRKMVKEWLQEKRKAYEQGR